MHTQPHYLNDEAALTNFLAAFEQARLPKHEWTHAAHVAMAAVFLRRYGNAVLTPTRTAIQRFNASVGGQPTAYNETLTILWLAIVAEALEATPCATDLAAATHAVSLFGGDKKLPTTYYSYDITKVVETRTTWTAPDHKPIKISFLLPSY